MASRSERTRLGFQSTETSAARLTLYLRLAQEDAAARALLPEVRRMPGQSSARLDLQRGARSSPAGLPDLVLTSLRTSHAMGAASAEFSAVIKSGRRDKLRAFAGLVAADDWVDITLYRHAKGYHVLRGRVDTVTIAEETGTGAGFGGVGGATAMSVRITGRSFGSCLQLTPLYYDIWADELMAAGIYARVLFGHDQQLPLSVSAAVRKLLYGFLDELGGLGRAVWALPDSVPVQPVATVVLTDLTARNPLAQHLGYLPDMLPTIWRDDPPRMHIGTFSWGDPAGRSLWDILSMWADLALCELYTDLVHASGRYLGPRDAFVPEDEETVMAVILRDKPFPTGSRLGETWSMGPWFDSPASPTARIRTFEVPEQGVVSRQVGRSDALRKNAFWIAPALLADLGPLARVLQRPLWDPQDIRVHGLRRFEPETMYIQKYEPNAPLEAQENTILLVAERYRNRLRDWHCLDHLLLTGTIQLAMGRPDIRVGNKLRIVGRREEDVETYYVERVEHTWSLPAGLRTSVDVSRGWRGAETGGPSSLLGALRTAVARYETPQGTVSSTVSV